MLIGRQNDFQSYSIGSSPITRKRIRDHSLKVKLQLVMLEDACSIQVDLVIQ